MLKHVSHLDKCYWRFSSSLLDVDTSYLLSVIIQIRENKNWEDVKVAKTEKKGQGINQVYSKTHINFFKHTQEGKKVNQ